jgi:hypothetical protein
MLRQRMPTNNNNRDVHARTGLGHRSSPIVISLAWDMALNATIRWPATFWRKDSSLHRN